MAVTSKKGQEVLKGNSKLNTLPGFTEPKVPSANPYTQQVTTSNKKLQEENVLDSFVTSSGTQGKKGQKTPRMNLAIQEDVYEYIRRESRKNGLTYSEFICAVMRERQQRLGDM